MDIRFSYIIYSFIFLVIWLVLFLIRRDIRRRMLLFSLIASLMGPLSEFWFLKDYWKRQTILGYPLGIEDLLFAFAIGGITYSIYKILFKKHLKKNNRLKPQKWLIAGFTLTVLLSLLVLTNVIGINSIFSSSIAFIIVTILIWISRPDLIKPSIISGFLVLLTFIVVYQIIQIFFPTMLIEWCYGCNPSGIRILNINIEELLWDFCWGLVGSIIYPAYRGKEFKDFIPSKNVYKKQTFKEFKDEADKEFTNQLSTKYGEFMASSSNDILSIRISRIVQFHLTRTTKTSIDIRWVFLIIAMAPQALKLLLIPFGSSCYKLNLTWLSYSSILLFFLFQFPKSAWEKLILISDSIDDMFINNKQREKYTEFLRKLLDIKNQIILSFFGTAISIITILIFSPVLEKVMNLGVPFYICVGLTGGLGINSIFWMWNIPLQIRYLSKFEKVNVNWNDPSSTRGIRNLSLLLGLSSIYAAIGLALFNFPLLWVLFELKPDSFITTLLYSIALLGSFSTVLFLTIAPQYWLYKIIFREKCNIIDQLSKEIRIDLTKHENDKALGWGNLENKINIFNAVKNSQTFAFGIQTILKYGIALITIVIPYIPNVREFIKTLQN